MAKNTRDEAHSEKHSERTDKETSREHNSRDNARDEHTRPHILESVNRLSEPVKGYLLIISGLLLVVYAMGWFATLHTLFNWAILAVGLLAIVYGTVKSGLLERLRGLLHHAQGKKSHNSRK